MSNRFIPHSKLPPTDFGLVKANIHEALLYNVHRVQKYYDSSSSDGRIYTGIPGAALMHVYLSELSLPGLPSSSDLLSRSNIYLSAALSNSSRALVEPPDAGHTAFLDTSVGLATLVLIAALQSRGEGENMLADAIPASVQVLNTAATIATSSHRTDSEDCCEVLYGRAGLLYALIRLRSASADVDSPIAYTLKPIVADSTLSGLVDAIIRRGKNGSAAYTAEISMALPAPALMWSWHGKRYLGGAHGVAGILYMILASPAKIIVPYISEILDTIEWLVNLQDARGNWPTKAPDKSSTGNNELVQWCHGASAILVLFSKTLKLSANPKHPITLSPTLHNKLHTSVQQAASLIYSEGLLRKGVGLCHGTSGSIFALLSISDILDPSNGRVYLSQAMDLAHFAMDHQLFVTRGEMLTADHPWSLYEGLGGMCCAWGAILQRLDGKGTVGMPGYGDVQLA